MGSLAFWSAMAGAGKGWREGVIAKEDSKQKQLQRDHDTALQKARLDFENERFSKGEENEMARHAETVRLQEEQLESLDTQRKETLDISREELELRGDQLGIQRDQFESDKEYKDALGQAARSQAGYYDALSKGDVAGKGAAKKGYQQFTLKEAGYDEQGMPTEKEVLYSFDKDTNTAYRMEEGVGLVEVGKAELINRLPKNEQALIRAPERWEEYLEALTARGMPAVLPPAFIAIHGMPEGYNEATTE